MKWFGVDCRYVIAGIGAVFILTYEDLFPGLADESPVSGESKPAASGKPDAQAAAINPLKDLNEKFARTLNQQGVKLLDAKASVINPDDKKVSVILKFEKREKPTFFAEELKYLKTYLLGLTCSEGASYFDHSVRSVGFEIQDGLGQKIDTAEFQSSACKNFLKDLYERNLDITAWAAAGKYVKNNPQKASALINSGVGKMPEIDDEPGYRITSEGVGKDGVLRYRIRHLEQADPPSGAEINQMRAGSFNGVCLNGEFADRLAEGFPAYEIIHTDRDDREMTTVRITREMCKAGRLTK